MMLQRLFPVALVVSLAACVPTENGLPVPTLPSENACGAAGLQGLIGQPQAVLQTMKFGVETRIIEAGMAVTLDHRPERLNILIGETGLIDGVSCG